MEARCGMKLIRDCRDSEELLTLALCRASRPGRACLTTTRDEVLNRSKRICAYSEWVRLLSEQRILVVRADTYVRHTTDTKPSYWRPQCIDIVRLLRRR